MNVNNIIVEELGSKYNDSKYKDLFQIQVDYKNSNISKMLYLDKESIKALNTSINTLLGTTIVPHTSIVNHEIKRHVCGKDCDINLSVFRDVIDANEVQQQQEIKKKIQRKVRKPKKITRSKKRLN